MGWTWKDRTSEFRGSMRSSWRSILLLALAGSTAVGIAAAGQIAFLTKSETHPISFLRGLAIELPIWWYWALATPVVLAAGRRFPLTGGRLARGVPIHLAIMLGLVALHAVVLTGVNGFQPTGNGPPQTFLDVFLESVFNRSIIDVLVYATILGLGHAWDYHGRLQDRAMDTARLETELAHAELQALKMQMHPHFLFNTLNTAAVLTEENPASAKEVLGLLADLLRATLDQSGVQEIQLSEELELLETYLAIERTRFPDRLSVDFQIEAGLGDAWVPNLVLQPLVENAVRYAIAPRAAPGRITVGARRVGEVLVLTVADDGPGITAGRNGAGAGLGLSNTRARLERLYANAGRLDLAPAPGGRGTVATVRLPFRAGDASR